MVSEGLAEHVGTTGSSWRRSTAKRPRFLPYLLAAEREIAGRAGPGRFPRAAIIHRSRSRKRSTWCQEQTGVELAPSQLEALKIVFDSRAAIITGGPGVGKTTLVQTILKILRREEGALPALRTDRAGGQAAFGSHRAGGAKRSIACLKPSRPAASAERTGIRSSAIF